MEMSIPFSYTNPPSGNGYRVQSRMCLESDYFRRQYETGDVAAKSEWRVRESEDDDEDDKVDVTNITNNGRCPGAGDNKIHKSESNSSCCVCFNSGEEQKVNGVIQYRSSRSNLENGSRAANNIIASYGVYGNDRGGNEAGFKTTANYYPEHLVVVTSQRDGTTTNSIITNNGDVTSHACHWCWCRGADSRGSISAFDTPTWCKPTVLLLVLALLLLVFVVVSGILLYFNSQWKTDC